MGKESTGKARTQTHRLNKTHWMGDLDTEPGRGVLHAFTARTLLPVLAQGYGAKLTQPENKCPPHDGPPAGLKGCSRQQFSALKIY